MVRADLEVDLVGFELDDGFAGFDPIALFLQPARDSRLDDRLPKLRNNDVGHTSGLLCEHERRLGGRRSEVERLRDEVLLIDLVPGRGALRGAGAALPPNVTQGP